MRSISSKLILAFLSIGIVSVAILFTTARSNTKAEFIRFLSDQTEKDIIAQLSIYHRKNGSWDGVERIFLLKQRTLNHRLWAGSYRPFQSVYFGR